MAFKIKLKRGTKANLPTLSDGEPAFTTDEKELYIGSSSSGNVKLTRNSEVDQLKSNSHTHSNKSIIDTITSALISNWNSAYSHISDAVKHITASERTLWNTVSNKSDKGHTHDDRYYTESEANSKFATKTEISSLGNGDMLKSVYDTNGDGVVDKAASVDWSGITSKPSTYTPSSHTHNYAGSSSAGGAATSALTCTGNSATATKLATARTINGTSFDGSANITITAAANGGTSAACTGNSATATKLQTARTINGTSFNGSTNITTANWGTARTITIDGAVNGSASIDGSGNKTITVNAKRTDLTSQTVDINTYNLSAGSPSSLHFVEKSTGGSTNISNIPVKQPFLLDVYLIRWTSTTDYITKQVFTSATTKSEYTRWCTNGTWSAWLNEARMTTTPVSGQIMISDGTTGGIKSSGYTIAKSVPSNAVFTDTNTWRGIQDNLTSTSTTDSLSANQGKILKGLVDGKAASSHTHNYAGSSSAGGAATTALACTGNAATATKLATARTINGTSFNGSANITTANWGTARTLTVGNTGKSVNGSANVAWSLNEIGALPGSTVSATTAATAQWYRIAQTTSTDQANTIGTFSIRAACSGKHSSTIITAGISYGVNPILNQLAHTTYSGVGISKARVVYHTTYSGNRAYLEVYVPDAAARTIDVQLSGSLGWSLVTPNTVGSIPSGYTNLEITFATSRIVANVTGSLSGNASTATRLQTARTINGTSFNGSANITTANWGTARTITIGSTGKSVNGSANVSWSLAEIGAAASSHTHNYAGSSSAGGAATTALACTGNAATATTSNYLASNTRMDYNWNGMNYFNISGTAGTAAKANNTPTTAWWHIMRFNHANSSGYYTDLAVPFNDTSLYYKRVTSGAVQNGGWVKVLDSLNYNSYAPTKTGTGASGTWGISVTGNAATATKLATARTISLTGSVTGSGTFDGSGNLSISTSTNHTHSYLPLSGGTVTGSTVFSQGILVHNANASGGTSGYINVAQIKITSSYANQPVSIALAQRGQNQISTIEFSFANSSSTDPALSSFIKTGPVNAYIYKSATSTWDLYVQKTESYDNIDILDIKKGSYMSNLSITWKNTIATSLPTGYTTASVKSVTTNISGNAGTATRLQTARTINGTSFNGSANITTANWGTARTITIGSTGKSVNGSGNVSWSLAEIGAAASSHTHNYAGSSSAGGAATTALACTGNAATATKLATARTISLTGSVTGSGTFDGSGNLSIATSTNHSHSYLPLSGGTLTGAMRSSVTSSTHIAANKGTVIINSTAAGTGYNMLAKMNSTNGVWTFGSYGTSFNFYYTTNATITAGTNNVTKTLKLLDESGNSAFPGTVSGTFSGSLSGNASTATRLQTARTINGTSFNGSANITTANWGTARTITIGNTGKSVNGSGNVSWTLAEIGAMKAGPVTWNNLKGV